MNISYIFYFIAFYYFFYVLEVNVQKLYFKKKIIIDNNISLNKYTGTFNSFIHSVIIVIWSYLIYPKYTITTNTTTENLFIIFYLTYFIKDLYTSYILQEYHFICHHIVSIFPGIVSLYYNLYGSFIVIGLFNAEITNPIQQFCLLVKFTKNVKLNINSLFMFNNCFFILNRTFITPIVYYRLLNKLEDSYILLNIFIYNAILLYTMSLYWSICLLFYKILPQLYNHS